MIFNIDRNGLVDRPEDRDSRKVIAPLNTCMHIHHRERLLSQLRENLLLQILFQHLNTYNPSWSHKTTNNSIQHQHQDQNPQTLTTTSITQRKRPSLTGKVLSDDNKNLPTVSIRTLDLKDLKLLHQLFLIDMRQARSRRTHG